VFPGLTRMQKAATFSVLSLALAWVIAVAVPSGSDGGRLLTMFTPVLALLLMLLVVTPEGYRRSAWAGLGLRRLGVSAWSRAILVPAAVVTAGYLIALALGFAELARPAWNGGPDVLPSVCLALALGLAEEIGWRGYLLPLLAPCGPQWACVAVGLVHGAWHLPLMLLTATYNPLGNRAVTIPVMLLVFAGAGIFYGELRLATSSVWPVVLAHQSFNSTFEWFEASTDTAHPTALAYTVGETGVVTLVLVAVVAAVLLRDSRRWQPTQTPRRRPPAGVPTP
jgi:uncharacterized protein